MNERLVPAAALCLVLSASGGGAGPAGEPVPEYRLKAEFLERFTRFVEWPPQALGDASAPFVIGSYGDNPFGAELEELARSRRIKGRAIQTRTVGGLDGIAGCHLLFVPRSQSRALPRIVARAAEHPILTVGEDAGRAEAGLIISFFEQDERLRFEINEEAARRSGLRIGAQLLQLARLVGGGTR